MIITNILFYICSICLVTFTFMVVTVEQPVFSVIFLSASFVCACFLMFLLECEFLALLFLIIYLGAVIILFLFANMMLESKLNNFKKNQTKYVPIGLFFSIFLFAPFLTNSFLSFVINDKINTHYFYFNIYYNWYNLIDSVNDVHVYSQILYSYYVLQFLISGFVLLLILMGVVYLTNIFYKNQINTQLVFKQLSRSSKFFN